MKIKEMIALIFFGILIAGSIGIYFVISEKNKRADDVVRFEKEKAEIIQDAKERDHDRQYVINSLKAVIVYTEASHALDTAQNLSDLGLITDILLKHMVEYGRQKVDTRDIWSFVDRNYPKVRTRLYQLGQVFFNSEARAINSTEDLEKFRTDMESAGRIVPIYQLNDHTDIQTYWEKSHEFGRK